MNRTLIAIVLLAMGSGQAEEFKCYSCSSLLDSYCGDSDALIAKGEEAMDTCLLSNKQCYYSRIELKDGNDDIVTRSCSPIFMKNKCDKVKDKSGKAVECYCDTSLCNSASKNYLGTTFIMITSITLFLYR